MQKVTIGEAIESWDNQDLSNLWTLVKGEGNNPTIQEIEHKFKWLYHSKKIANAKLALRRRKQKDLTIDDIRKAPSYDQLLIEAAKKTKAYEGNPSLEECEAYLAHAVIIAALQRMSPRQRLKFFTTNIPIDEMADSAGFESFEIKGPATTLAALGVAQVSGFGVYIASTTALGLLTHAVGISLPFAVYTGLTSTIAFIIGPVGWLSAGIWGVWRFTRPEWKYIIPALLYIASTNSRQQMLK